MRRSASNRPRARDQGPPETVEFPVAPMLDMSFQLLAFFILTFQAPSNESRIDLYLPASPAVLATSPAGDNSARSGLTFNSDLETDLVVRAISDELGDLTLIELQGSEVPSPAELTARLRAYREQLVGEPIAIRLIADDRLSYDAAAKLIVACSAAGIESIMLSGAAPGIGAN